MKQLHDLRSGENVILIGILAGWISSLVSVFLFGGVWGLVLLVCAPWCRDGLG